MSNRSNSRKMNRTRRKNEREREREREREKIVRDGDRLTYRQTVITLTVCFRCSDIL